MNFHCSHSSPSVCAFVAYASPEFLCRNHVIPCTLYKYVCCGNGGGRQCRRYRTRNNTQETKQRRRTTIHTKRDMSAARFVFFIRSCLIFFIRTVFAAPQKMQENENKIEGEWDGEYIAQQKKNDINAIHYNLHGEVLYYYLLEPRHLSAWAWCICVTAFSSKSRKAVPCSRTQNRQTEYVNTGRAPHPVHTQLVLTVVYALWHIGTCKVFWCSSFQQLRCESAPSRRHKCSWCQLLATIEWILPFSEFIAIRARF